MKVLVTGATGFVGQHLIKRLTVLGHEIVCIVRDIDHYQNRWWKREQVAYGDITNPVFVERVVTDYSPDIVFHLAAQSIVRTARNSPYNTFETNAIGTLNILESCRKSLTSRVFIMSTDKVYGNTMDASEHASLRSSGFYETSKVCVDHIAQTYARQTDLSITIIRPCNIYGPGDRNKRIIPNMVQEALVEKTITLFKGNDDKREYIYINDLVNALITMIDSNVKGIYNIGTGNVLDQVDIAECIGLFLPVTTKMVTPPNFKKAELHQQSVDHKKITSLWKPNVTIRDGIKNTIRWWRDELKLTTVQELLLEKDYVDVARYE